MGQTKKHSIVESLTNVAVGYGVSVLSQIILFPLFGIHVSVGSNMKIGLWFTAISILRSCLLRRFFNKVTVSRLSA